MNSIHLSRNAERQLERKFQMDDEAHELIGLIAAEFSTDPMSAQCFDLRVVERVKDLARRRKEWQAENPYGIY